MRNRIAWIGSLSFSVTVMAWATAFAGGTPLTVELVASGLNRPLYVTHATGDFERIYIVEKRGTILVHNLVTTATSTFMDITARVGTSNSLSSEQGLLGLAFHPGFAGNSFFYVNYTNNSGDTVVSRFTANTSDLGDSSSESIVMTINQPQGNHNGGWIAFGPDGFLYIATGDGGNFDDQGTGHTEPGGNSQDITSNLLGKLLRIDVNSGSPYAIPPDNPFVGETGDDEIWAYGLRNPWRNAFDRATGELYIADVGQGDWEEVSFQRSNSTGGENYGWRCREGAHNFNFTGACGLQTFVEPIYEFSHGGAPFRCSITGGEVYRGCAIADLSGTYFFADWCSDNIWSFRGAGGSVTDFEDRTAELATGGVINDITSFGLDAAGEMYICDHTTNDGRVYKIVSAGGPRDDCNLNGVEDACDILSGGSPDDNSNGTPDECEVPVTPLPTTDGFLKNRYISFRPNNIVPVAFRVELTTSLNHPGAQGTTWWVDVPNAEGIALLTGAPVTRSWNETVVHVTGCEIGPVATYQVRATVDDGGNFSSPLDINTTPQPGGGKWWGDTVGFFDGELQLWTPQQGTTNIDDAVAIIKAWQEEPGAPPIPVVDVEPQAINLLVNINDVFAVIRAFQGDPYPFGCPADPCQNNIAIPCP